MLGLSRLSASSSCRASPRRAVLLAGALALASARALAGPTGGTVVVGSDEPARDDPAAVSIIDLRHPGQRGAGRSVSLADVIEGEAGVGLRSSGGLGQFSGALLRGASPTQVAILLDGVPLSRGGQAAVDLSQLPVDGLERVEIYRGVPPLGLGIDAIGGAINLVTRRGTGRTLSLLAGGGSFGLRKAGVFYSSRQGGLRVAADLVYQGATGDFPYYYTGGFVYSLEGHGELLRRNDGFDQVSGDVRVGYERGGLALRVQATGMLKRQGVAGLGQPGAQPGQPDLTTGRAMLLLGASRRLLGGRAELSAEGHVLLDRGLYRDLEAAPAALAEAMGGQAGGQAQLRLGLHPGQLLLVLTEARYEHFRSSDLCPAPRADCDQALPTVSERLRGGLAMGGDLRIDEGRLVLQPALHLSVARSHLLPLSGGYAVQNPGGGEVDSTTWFASPRAGARVRLLPWLLARASAGRFVRLPTFLELFGDRAFFRANQALRPESSWSLEGGVGAQGAPRGVQLSVEATAFGRLVDDLIDTVREGPQLRARNVGTARMLGAEAELRFAYREFVAARLTYTLLDARDLSQLPGRSGNLLPGRPQHAVFLRVDAGYGPLRLFYELDHTSLLYLDPGNLQPRPGRTLHGLGVRLGPYSRVRLSLAVEVRNLLDTRIVAVPLSLTGDGRPALTPLSDFFDYPLPGRAMYATLTAQR